MAKLNLGDVAEIKTAKGLAYALYTHKHKQYGALIRVLDGLHLSRPDDLSGLNKSSVLFSCFFPLSAAVDRSIVSIVGNVGIPNSLLTFPTFRAGAVDPKTQKAASWWLWDGEKEWRIGDLNQEQRKLPIRGVWNDTLLVDRIESGWTPETDPAW